MTDEPYEQREQSAAKHQILERYLKAFAPIVGTWAEELVYVDCFAGPWNSKSADLSDTSFFRAIKVLQHVRSQGRCKRVRALLVEKDPARFSQLRTFAATISDVEVIPKQWDFANCVNDIAHFVRDTTTDQTKVFPFFFIDPWGWDLITIDRIRPLLLLDPGEVLITFMSSFVNRFFGDPSKPLERLLGHAEVRRLRELHGEELEDELVGSYANAIKTAGRFPFSCAVPVMDPKRDRFIFHMVFATRNMKGVEEFKEAERDMINVMHRLRAEGQRRRAIETGSSGFLFDSLTTYRESRFSRYRANALTAFTAAAESQLKAERRLFVQDLLNLGLQHSAVLKDDIYDLIWEWLDQRKAALRALSERQRALRPENIIEYLE